MSNVTVMCFLVAFMMQDVEVWYLTSILPVPEGFINENQPIRRFGYGDRWLFFPMLGYPSFSWKAETVHATATYRGSFYYGSTAVHHFLGTIGSLGSEF
jgi:hypothetical protein